MRLPKIMDWIATDLVTKPETLVCELSTLPAWEYGLGLVKSGRWRVYKCGLCKQLIDDCKCKQEQRNG